MKLKIMGSGSAFSRCMRSGNRLPVFNSNFLICNRGRYLLIDYGRTANEAFDYLDLNRDEIDSIIVSHLHADHVGGLEELAILNKVKFGRRPNIISTDSILEKLWNQTLKGGLGRLFNGDKSGAMKLEDYFVPMPAKADAWNVFPGFEGLEIMMVKTRHIEGMESYGYLLRTEGRLVYLSGDTIFDPEKTVLYGREADVIIHDVQLEDSGPDNEDGVHPSLRQLRGLPEAIKKKTYFYHFDVGCELPALKGEFAGFTRMGQEFGL